MAYSILFVEYSRETGGSVVCLLNYLKALDRKKFRPIVLVPEKNFLTEKISHYAEKTIYFEPKENKWLNVLPLMKIIRETGADLVHTNDELASNFDAVLASRLSGTPVVCFAMGENKPKFFQRIAGRMADRIFCVSGAVLGVYRGLGFKNLELLHHGVDPGEYRPAEKNPALKKMLGLSKNDFVFLAAGRLVKLKGLDYLLKAFAEVTKESAKVKLLIAGEGPEKKPLKALAERLGLKGKALFLGNRKDVKQLYGLADVVVQSIIHHLVVGTQKVHQAGAEPRRGINPSVVFHPQVEVSEVE